MAKRRKKQRAKTVIGGVKLPAKGRMREIADELWSIAVRKDWANKCAVCRSTDVEAHHLIPREHEKTRFTLRNGIALCSRCHKLDPDSPHMNAAAWMHWLEGQYPLLVSWYYRRTKDGRHKTFTGTKTPLYYCDILQGLRQYVSAEEFESKCGVKFSAWLQDQIDTKSESE